MMKSSDTGRGGSGRPCASGRFLWVGQEKLHLRGVTYGTFRTRPETSDLPSRETVRSDLAAMAAAGINAVRTYTPPPEWMLDLAGQHGIHVLVGLPWEHHVAFLERRSSGRSIASRVREAARSCAGHPAVLGYAVGNEIPAPIVRWHGRRRIESFIERLYDTVKDVDPDGLVTYVNFPTTEYLQLPFLDFACFNVYLEARRDLRAYLARLHNLVGDQPLVMTELGLDSRRNGAIAQADTLAWQLDTAFESGCAGTFVFAWTDEWHRGGYDIEDWDFGLVDRARRPKPALHAVSRAYHELAHRRPRNWPRVSVVVCSYNGERWLPGCFDALERLDYPEWEVVVVSDGSTDGTDALTLERGFRLIRSGENRGLSTARNLGLETATGEIVAYVDDDARPDADWLRHLALSFERGSHAAMGGPNIPPEEDGLIARCVASSPGGPIHVLVGDDLAEHVPGCNLAVRRDCLQAVDGFDPRYWIAGDDVDLCWRLQREGYTIGFNPAAVVRHHRRGSILAYLKQQFEYGKAEGLLHKKWPERYNRLGHLSWSGSVYGSGTPQPARSRRAKVHYGPWGSRPFQSIYEPPAGPLKWLPALPEWYLLLGVLALLSLLGLQWKPLLLAIPPLALGLVSVLAAAAAGTRAATVGWRRDPAWQRLTMVVVTFLLHLLQPPARLSGRLRGGLAPWRRHCKQEFAVPRPRRVTVWAEHGVPAEQWLSTVEARLQASCLAVARGSDSDRWDLQVRGGAFGVARLLCAVEEHGGGRQLARFSWWPRYSRAVVVLLLGFGGLTVAALVDRTWIAFAVLGLATIAVSGLAVLDCAAAAASIARALDDPLSEPAYEAIPEPVPISSPARPDTEDEDQRATAPDAIPYRNGSGGRWTVRS
jgi:GT2 family glycosyltransferase